MNAESITAVILTKNEEANLPRALASLPQGVSLLVLDSLSTDATAQIASAAGATIIQREWRGYIDARTFALSHVRTPWTFMIDADEALDPVLRDAIATAEDNADGYRIARTTYFCGRPMRIWSNERILRLFRTERATLRSRAMNDNAQVHEVWSVKGTTLDLRGTLLHFSYPTIAAYRSKFERYTALEAGALRPAAPRIRVEEAKAFLRFLQLLVTRGGLLDGWRGVYAAWWSAWYPAVASRKANQASKRAPAS